MISQVSKKTIPLRKSKFTFSSIELTKSDPAEVTVSLIFPGHLPCFESTMTGSQFYKYGQFQTVIALDHGIQPYVVEVEQSRCSRQRALIWREFFSYYLPELG
ncbi:hypothetical protein [uncultured Gimesia sp.]|uniref:hypothetical protein n=1 Tax=uncultured Gimesia sp. TaxID=1678688 RepID=UPI0026307976|nr:hypothetical protein [uncultured Gimesia sp.]